MKKSIIKHYIADQENPVKEALRVMECRAKGILDANDWYKELYIDPSVDIVNSHPQVIQQVENEISDFLFILKRNNVKNLLQVGLGHWLTLVSFSQDRFDTQGAQLLNGNDDPLLLRLLEITPLLLSKCQTGLRAPFLPY